MKIGINFRCKGNDDIGKQIKLLLENGFETTFIDSTSPYVDEIMKSVKKAGIICESVHAPFDGINNMWYDGAAGDVMLRRLMQSVDVCSKYEIPVSVVHLSSGVPAPRINDIGYERFAKLMDYADKHGVVIAYENQRVLSNIAFVFEQFPQAGFCWDVGHEECFAHGRRYMPLFGDRLCALHVHDNMKKHNGDLHLIPDDGCIDFECVAKQIAASGYEKSIMLEVMCENSSFYSDFTDEEYYKRASGAARRLADRVELCKSEKK